MSRRLNNGKCYKKTKQEQYNVLIRTIGKFCCDSGPKNRTTINNFWNELKDKLNSIGPPTRNITEWKKVWNDCKRSRRRREHIRYALKSLQEDPTADDNNVMQFDKYDNHSESNDIEDSILLDDSSSQQSFENENTPNESSSIYNDYAAEFVPKQEKHKPDKESHNDEYAENFTTQLPKRYTAHETQEYRRFESVNFPISLSADHGPPPPLHEATTSAASRHAEERESTPEEVAPTILLQHTMYNVQNQMDHQTKLLENMSEISGTMVRLMERQVMAIERQTEAVRRQAAATEHHTLVMNSFLDMIKNKMPNNSSNLSKTTNSPPNDKK